MPKLPKHAESLPIEGRKLAYAFDTKTFPGKVQVRYVTFSTEMIADSDFVDQEFQLVDRRDPRIKAFLKSQGN